MDAVAAVLKHKQEHPGLAVSPKIASKLTGLSTSTLARRRRNRQPPFCWRRMGSGLRAPIRYSAQQLLEWLSEDAEQRVALEQAPADEHLEPIETEEHETMIPDR